MAVHKGRRALAGPETVQRLNSVGAAPLTFAAVRRAGLAVLVMIFWVGLAWQPAIAQQKSNDRAGNNALAELAPAGDGITDDTAALQAILDRRQIVYLQPFRTYRITRSLRITARDTGIVGDGTARLIMGSRPGEFDNEGPEAFFRYQANAVGIIAEKVTRPILQGVQIEYEGQVDDRYVKAAAFRNCTDIIVTDNNFSKFSKADGIIYIGATTGGTVTGNVIRDSHTNSSTWGQITGILFDDHDPGSSEIEIARNDIRNLTVGRNFRSRYDVQTDGINVGVRSRYLNIWGNTIANVGEGVDNFGQDIRIDRNQITTPMLYGIKLIHGASRSTVTNNVIRDAGLGGVVIAGSPAVTTDTADNVVSYNQISRVNPFKINDQKTTFGIAIMNVGGTLYLARRNKITNNSIDLGGTALFGILAETGSGTMNVVGANDVSNFQRSAQQVDPIVVP